MRALALLPICLSLVAQAPASSVAVAGRVLDEQGRPIVGAAVALVQLGVSAVPAHRAATDAKGEFQLKAPKGTYALTATHTEWSAAYLPKVEVAAPAAVLPPVTMKAGGRLVQGTVEGPKGGSPIRLALARVSKEDGDVFLVEPQEGAFQLRLPEGDYVVLAEGATVRSPKRLQVGEGMKPAKIQLEALPSAAPKEVREWIKAHAVPLRGVEAGEGFADMAPLAKAVGQARVVSLGEATHGTREFFQMKHRMLEYLVSEQGFTAFAIEANLPECQALNEYVLEGKGDPKQGLDGIYFWTWNTEEVLALVEWMRAWNADPAHARKVRFYGFDNQTSTQAYAFVRARLAAEDPGLAAWMEKALGATGQPAFEKLEPAKLKALREAAAELGRRLDAKPAFDPFLRRCARVIEQKLDIDLDPSGGYTARDLGMAENVQWILQQEGSAGRIVLWAHNGHVQTDTVLDHLWMGGHLRKALGSQMVVFGFAFQDGAFQAIDFGPTKRGLRDFTVKPQASATLDEALASAGAPVLALDLRQAPRTGPVRDWFAAPQGTFGTGAGFREGGESAAITPTRILEAYDGLLFIAHTTAARPLHARSPKRRPTATPVNLGFEEGPTTGNPAGWFPNADMEAYDVSLSEEGATEGRRWMQVHAKAQAAGDSWGTMMQTLEAKAYRGKRVRLSGWARASAGSKATLWLRVDRPKAAGFFDNAMDRAVTQDGWSRMVIEGTVDEDAETLNFGAMVFGAGSAGFDGLKLEVLD